MADPLSLLKSRMQGAVVSAAGDIAESAIIEGSKLVRNGISNVLRRNGGKNEEPDEEDETEDTEDTEDTEEIDEDSVGSALPIVFDAFTEDKNLECAVAAWKLWGTKAEECDDDSELEPDIVAQFSTGMVFCGTMDQLQDFCEHNDLDEDVSVYGLDDDNNYDSSELNKIKVGKNIITYVLSFMANMVSEESEESFKGFHWDENATVTKVVRTIPFMDEIPLTMCGVAQAIIYTAKKGDKVETYIHEFGEDSGLKPIMYALPTPQGEKWPRSLLIHGGKMRVEDRGIVD